ncbi:hypothetical protein [Nakamurella leprariae]|uniref:Uncharacterized protein n=1 Tax=Nakamurella leprariae TaxID=2803911 RepID=A0A939C0Q2_9ACTN|nr:hypothetical protein [Nakamurella leprariae]MBM9466377.1 hypothetical protein [Nakamurella leprariae]
MSTGGELLLAGILLLVWAPFGYLISKRYYESPKRPAETASRWKGSPGRIGHIVMAPFGAGLIIAAVIVGI